LDCKNCGYSFQGNFCSQCGQSADTHRLSFGSIWNDIRFGIFHFNDKVYFTVRQLCLRPGHAIGEYLTGKRLSYMPPISFLLIIASLYAVLAHFFHLHVISFSDDGDPLASRFGVEETNDWIIIHYSWIALLAVPLFTVSTYIAFRKYQYNFIEHLAINSYLTAQRFFFLILTFPIVYALDGTPYFKAYSGSTVFVGFLLMFWGFSQLFRPMAKTKILLLLSFAYTILFALIVILAILLDLALHWFIPMDGT
jgi:hypothetical protein